jgi:hypothetical protein
MSVAATFIKDPNATLDYRIDWSEWLTDDDQILSSIWNVDIGITEHNAIFTDTSTKIWLTGGINLKAYNATNRIVTACGRTDDRTIKIICKEK